MSQEKGRIKKNKSTVRHWSFRRKEKKHIATAIFWSIRVRESLKEKKRGRGRTKVKSSEKSQGNEKLKVS